MTTFKHALGYNKDGVLGVAGLLGNGGNLLEQLGLLAWPNSSWSLSPRRTFNILPYGSSEIITSTDEVRPAYPNYTKSGNGIIVLGFGNSYAEVGSSVLKVVDASGSLRDVTIPDIPTTAINGMYGGQYPISIAGITFAEDKFLLSFYNGSAHQYVITEDFETFTGPYAAPSNDFNRGMYKTSNGDYIVTASYSGFKSSDLVTWTSISIYLDPMSSNTYSELYEIGTLSDGRKVIEAGSPNQYLAIDAEAKVGDIFEDFTGVATVLGSVPDYDLRYGFAGIVDGNYVGAGMMGGSLVRAYDQNNNLLGTSDLGSSSTSKRTYRVNDLVYVVSSETDGSRPVYRITGVSAAGIEYELVATFPVTGDSMVYNFILA